jgi:hypothetical protein
MRTKLLIFLLAAMALALAGANWYVRRPVHQADFPPPQERNSTPTTIVAATQSNVSPSAATPVAARFEWGVVETSDYKKYVVNLRTIGFPEELVRAIIIADINALYAPRENALKAKPVPHDAPLAQRQASYPPEEWDRILALRQVQMEKQAALKDILGIYVPRDVLRSPRNRNYEAFEYALGLLPESKRDAAQWIVEQEIITDGKNHEQYRGRDEVEAYRRSAEQEDSALRQMLTPEEFETFRRNSDACGTELARQVIGMEPTDQEFAAMYQAAYKCWLDCGGVYSRWRAMPVPPEQIAAAEQQLQVSLKEVLGADRYLDYQMATSQIGQQLRNLGARYDLPRSVLTQVFDLEKQAGQAAADQQLQQILGPDVWQAWQDGKNQRVQLAP